MLKKTLPLFSLSLFLLFASTNVIAACDSTLPAQGVRNDVLIIVNDNATDSCEVGRYYAEQRGLGQNNILHVRTPASYYIEGSEFKILRDQIINHLQKRVVAGDPKFIPATCTDGEPPFYCQASMDQLRASTAIRYIVMTKGVPTRAKIDGSTLRFPGAPTSIDNYFKYWLINYFATDTAFGAISQNRAQAFGNGRDIREVIPSTDQELIIGRIDGITLGSAKALIDRIKSAEANGLYGKIYSYTGLGIAQSPTGLVGMSLKDYSNNQKNIYDGAGDPWRYQWGIFGESAPECSDYQNPTHYLNFSASDSRGKAPQSCTVKLNVGLNKGNDSPPARASSRQPLADDALWYMGFLDGQSTTGNFKEFLNWRRDTSCSNTLCSDLPAGEQAACRAASTDVYKEIDTRCVGVAEGFIGYNFQSFPVSFLHVAPTGWNTGTAEGFKTGRAIVREDEGFNDTTSLWYQNNEENSTPTCYSSSDFSLPADTDCTAEVLINFNQPISFAATQISDSAAPDQYRVRFKYNAQNLNRAITLQAAIQVTEQASNTRISYRRVNATLAIPATTNTGWQDAEAILALDHTNVNHDVNWDGSYKRISLFLASNARFSGALGIDSISFEKLDPTGIAPPTPIALINPEFDQGHQHVTTGDHAANFLSRLNGVGFWGSLGHHQSGGFSFSRHSLETMVYFMRGLPLGDAVWFGENFNSGIFYGDPLYSPVAIKFASINQPFDFIFDNISLQGHTVNGRDARVVNTTYQVDYCPGSDFFDCDRQSTWQSTGLSGIGGQENTQLGIWDITGLTTGANTLRLAVTSTNQGTSKSQTFYDYYPIITADQISDFDQDGVLDVDELSGGLDPTSIDSDGDGLSDGAEIAAGTNPLLADTDGDGLSDGEEVLNQGTDPLSTDSDNDGMPDAWEVGFTGLDPLVDDAALDLDNDALVNLDEFTNATRPDRADTDRDRIDDGEEVANATDPLSNADRDLDGMTDDWERIRGTRVGGDDARVDADGDGVDNIIEFAHRTRPLDASSAPILKTWYVDAVNGDDTGGDGSRANPYASLLTAYNAVTGQGDTLQLASGNYSADFLFFNRMINIEGPADRSANVSIQSLLVLGSSWGGFSGVELNVGAFFNFANGRNLIFRNMELNLSSSMMMGRDSKLLLDHVLVKNTSGEAATAIVTGNRPGGLNRTNLEIRNSTITGFPTGISWGQSQFLRIRDSILANTVDLQNAQGYQVQNSLLSDGQFTGFGSNIVGDPLFVDAANGDYHLLPASPGVDSATPFASARAEPGSVRLNMGFYGGTAEATLPQDNDADGLPDGWETAVGLNPLDPLDRLGDNDGDGVNNTLEYRTGTLPGVSSSRRGPGYRVLEPEQFNGNIEVMSLVDGSYIFAPAYTRLDQFQTASIDTSNFTSGQRINNNHAMSMANAADGTDIPVPDWFAGHAFVIPHARNNHRYRLLSPYGDAQVRINVDGTEQTISAPRNQSIVFEAGNDNNRSGIIHSDLPIIVTHTAYVNSPVTRDAYAVPPASKEVSGIYSRFVYIGALEDNTQISITDSNGANMQFVLNAGERQALRDGGAPQGQGVSLQISANKPIAATQSADSDGIESTAFWDPIYSARRYGLPIDTQYAAVVCRQASDISLYDSSGIVLATQSCTPAAPGQPGKAYFGSATNGINISAGSYLIGSEPFYMMFESSATNDEKNILGHL